MLDIADTPPPAQENAAPIVRKRTEESDDVRRPPPVDAAGEEVRPLLQGVQGTKAAAGPPHRRDPFRIGDSLVDGPLHGVVEILLRAPSPLICTGSEESDAVSGRAAIVHLEHGIAP